MEPREVRAAAIEAASRLYADKSVDTGYFLRQADKIADYIISGYVR